VHSRDFGGNQYCYGLLTDDEYSVVFALFVVFCMAIGPTTICVVPTCDRAARWTGDRGPVGYPANMNKKRGSFFGHHFFRCGAGCYDWKLEAGGWIG